MQGDVGKNLLFRYFALLMPSMMLRDLSTGLERLEVLAEEAKAAAEKEAWERAEAEARAAEARAAEAASAEGGADPTENAAAE